MNSDHVFFLNFASQIASEFIGATTPNPPVGACVVQDGKILGYGAHIKAGTAHAEVIAIENAKKKQLDLSKAILYVTLEPCNHIGKTPACTSLILKEKIAHVVFAEKDPNPKVKGGGEFFLNEKKVSTSLVSTETTKNLLCSFEKKMRTSLPYFVHKKAYRLKDQTLTMIPENGQKTFTSETSLTRAHLERKMADAILTDYATVLADDPSFNVRYVSDHENKSRAIFVLSKSKDSLPEGWVQKQKSIGNTVKLFSSPETLLHFLKSENSIHRVLVECGPTLSNHLSKTGMIDEELTFFSINGKDSFFTQRL